MSDFSRIKARLKKENIKFSIEKPKKEYSNFANTLITFDPVKMFINPKGKIVGIYIFDMRVDIDRCVEKWSNDSEHKMSFADFLMV